MTSELEQEVKQLERAIAEQERKLAARRAYDDSAKESKQRSEAAKAVYKDLKAPMKETLGNPDARSYVPETFLQDLKLDYLDTRKGKGEILRQLQGEVPSTEDLRAAAAGSQPSQDSEKPADMVHTDSQDVLPLAGMETGALTLEQVQKMGIDKWNKLIYVNALEGNSKNAEQVLRLMEEVGVQPDMDSFAYLVEAYSNAGKLEKAQGTIENMLKLGLIPPLPAYSSLMKVHVKRRDITSTFRVFEALKEHHNPDVDVFTTLIKGCLRAGEYELGWKVFDQMQHSGAAPVESTYSLMIRACAKTDQVERALDIFKTYPARRLQPTDATFNSLIHACAMRPEYFVTAFALLNEMQNVYGFEPDILTYNTLLFACSKKRDLYTARRVFQKVVQLDYEGTLKLDGITVTNFLWCVTEWKDIDKHLWNYKYQLRHPEQAQIEPSPESKYETTTDISVRPPYFILPERPPKDEREALAEGESVFSWYISRCAEQFPFVEAEDTLITQDVKSTSPVPEESEVELFEAEQEDKDPNPMEEIVVQTVAVDLPLPRMSIRAPVRTRLLNAYLAMYVRHQDMDTSTEIYRKYFDFFHRKRDSWTYSIMLEGCYNRKDIDLGTEVFRSWRDWRKSTGKLTDKRSRQSDYQCYRRMINLLGRMNHLDESIALLEELSIAATPTTASTLSESPSPSTTSIQETPSTSSPIESLAESSSVDEISSSLAFLKPIQDQAVLPIYPQLKDFPVVYTKTWELEDEGARRLLLRLCHGKIDSLSTSSSTEDSILPERRDKRQARYQKAARNTSIKWKGEHPQEKGFYVGERRIRELEQDLSKRRQDRS
ncbi:hypothetical protein B0O80DRAFT_502869 [Mortierella sp. GBAus27b]|nr:hypothetical protein BGX31_007838 [Mortierella sp. GBA43]KAI8347306.1 hypothetical protein B0O80DRAFT_502869 [Mortierella sp. GBAus27b]